MKISMLRNAAKRYECSLGEGETGDVPDSLAQILITDKIAVPVSEEQKKVKAVPSTPAIKGE